MGDLKKIIEILESYEKDNGHYFNSILESDYENIAEEIVKLFAIRDVANRRELLLSYSEWWDKNYSPLRLDFHRQKDIDEFLSQMT